MSASFSPVAAMTARSDPHRRNRLLATLPEADYAILAPHLREVPLEQRQLLHEVEDEIEQVYFPHGGMICILAVMHEGDAIEIATVGREGVVGASAGLDLPRASSRAVVQVPGTASRIPASNFQKAVNQSDAIRALVVRHNEAVLVQAQQTAACNALHDVEARLARWLLQARDRTDMDAIPLTQEFLAQMLGVRRTTVNLVARTLHKAGLIHYRRGQIEILNRAGLEREACDCYGLIRRQLAHILPDSKGGSS